MDKLLPEVQAFVQKLELSKIPAARQEVLRQLIGYIQKRFDKDVEIRLNFICTHNSRRSQLCQVWATTAARYYEIDQVIAFSGGTEATAFHANAIRALKNSGFNILQKKGGKNPIYLIQPSLKADPLPYFSKVYNDSYNTSPYAAIMTCSDAEVNCPFIPEAEVRFAIKYEDPKKADGRLQEVQTYAERNRQIATEMFYIFSNIKNK